MVGFLHDFLILIKPKDITETQGNQSQHSLSSSDTNVNYNFLLSSSSVWILYGYKNLSVFHQNTYILCQFLLVYFSHLYWLERLHLMGELIHRIVFWILNFWPLYIKCASIFGLTQLIITQTMCEHTMCFRHCDFNKTSAS